jgi:isocitrate dehydrogenase kinase/phosphatase
MVDKSHRDLIAESSQIIYDGFIRYNNNFHRLTKHARVRFEQRDWKGHQKDIVDRVDLYEKSVRRIVLILRRILGPRVNDHELWNKIRSYFGERLNKVPDAGFIQTFFNSITRRIFGTVGTNPQLEFVSSLFDEDTEPIKALNLRRYPYWGSLERIFETILDDFSFRTPYSNLQFNAIRIANDIEQYIQTESHGNDDYLRFEFIDSYFYQSARAYLVGRIIMQDDILPIVIAFKNEDSGIHVDAVLMSDREVSIVFGYTRSYYFANPNSFIGAVHFLHSIIPKKPIDELYTVLGRLRQGKTERYRIFTEHLYLTDDKFVHAPGDKGLVMIVFTLPSYDLVFKVIRDKFGYPKTLSRNDVIGKYKLVSKHDRAGRLIDTQEFLNLEFPVNRFSDSLLDELLKEASQTVKIEGDDLLIGHVYIERRVNPLNLYINSAPGNDAELAIIDYGQTIKDLAQTNIFPGDLLLKNFGVTRHNRVVFYDYDEVSLVTECNFRDIPEPEDSDNELRADAWYYIAKNDIFPEEFIKFLSMDKDLSALFMAVHHDLMTPEYWRNIKDRHLAGEVPVVIPYLRPASPPGRSQNKKSA